MLITIHITVVSDRPLILSETHNTINKFLYLFYYNIYLNIWLKKHPILDSPF